IDHMDRVSRGLGPWAVLELPWHDILHVEKFSLPRRGWRRVRVHVLVLHVVRLFEVSSAELGLDTAAQPERAGGVRAVVFRPKSTEVALPKSSTSVLHET